MQVFFVSTSSPMKVVALRGDLGKLKTSKSCSQKLFKNVLVKYYMEQVLQPQPEHQQSKLDLFKVELRQIMVKLNW